MNAPEFGNEYGEEVDGAVAVDKFGIPNVAFRVGCIVGTLLVFIIPIGDMLGCIDDIPANVFGCCDDDDEPKLTKPLNASVFFVAALVVAAVEDHPFGFAV